MILLIACQNDSARLKNTKKAEPIVSAPELNGVSGNSDYLNKIDSIQQVSEKEDFEGYHYQGQDLFSIYQSNLFDSLLKNLNLHQTSFQRNKTHGACQIDCCSEVSEDRSKEYKLISVFTDCGDNGLYQEKWLFKNDKLLYHQELNYDLYSQNDTLYLLNDYVFYFDTVPHFYARSFTQEEYKRRKKDKKYTEARGNYNILDSTAKANIEMFFQMKNITEDDI